MAYSGRSSSPGGRRVGSSARASDHSTLEPSYHSRHSSHSSPRVSTGGVIPISKETFINIPPPRDAYSGRPRRSSLIDSHRSTAIIPVRSASGRQNIVQNEHVRGGSPSRLREKEYYVVPASSQEPRGIQHKKLYSIDDGTAKLVADVNMSAERHNGRRESGEYGGYRVISSDRDRGRRGYYVSHGPQLRDKSIDDEDAFSYTDAAGMYRDTEPRRTRTRRGSLDRAGLGRERAVSMVEADPRRSAKDLGPPPSTRGWDKLPRSARDELGTSPTRARGYTDGLYGDPREILLAAPRAPSVERRPSSAHPDRYDPYEYDDRREARYRRSSVSRADRSDRSVERRGFGIRGDSRSTSKNPYRSSDESFDQARMRDSSRVESRWRDAAPPDSTYDDDRRYVDSYDSEDYERPSDRDRRDTNRRRDRRERDYDQDRERERDRARHGDTPGDHTDSAKIAQAAAGGLAAAAATAGVASALHRSDKRERDDDRDLKERRHDLRGSGDHSKRDSADRDRDRDPDRGLGFAFENASEISRTAPPVAAEYASETSRDVPSRKPVPSRDTDRDPDLHSVEMPKAAIDPDEEYRRRIEQVQRELGTHPDDQRSSDSDPDRVRRRREREQRLRDRGLDSRNSSALTDNAEFKGSSLPHRSFDDDRSTVHGTARTTSELRRKPSILDLPMTEEPAQIIDNSQSSNRENRVRIVDPPTEEEDKRPRGILKKPTEKFPEDPNAVREGVAPLKDATKKGIPPGAKWTKIDRRLVNPAALEEAGERYEERQDCVIVLRVLTKEAIQKLADRTKEIRERNYHDDKKARHRERERRDRDEYSDEDSADEYKKKPPKMLEAPSAASGSTDDSRRRERDRISSGHNISGGR